MVVIKRDGREADFDKGKIATAILSHSRRLKSSVR